MLKWPLQLCVSAWLLLIAAGASAQTTRPAGLVDGDDVAVRPAARRLKVVCDNWPDASSLRQFGLDAIRLEGAKTDEQKAIAIWRWVRRATMAAGNGIACEPTDSYISDPSTVLNVYGAHHCDGLSRLMAAVWRDAAELPAVKLYRSGHTMADCWWVDDDGVGRYHMFDVNYGYFLYDRDGKHLVSADDIGTDFSLVAWPSRTARPWLEKQWWMYSWIHCAWAEERDYDGTLNLRAGEQVERLWGNTGRLFHASALKSGPDPDNPVYPLDSGNATFAWRETFGPGWTDRLAIAPLNATVRDGQLGQLDDKAAGQVVYRGRFPYVVADVDLSLRAGRAGRLLVETSVDNGRNWQSAAQVALADGEARTLALSKLLPKWPDGQPESGSRARPSRSTPLGRYDYLLRLTLLDGATLAEVGCATTVQHNYLVLPNLIPGDNHITVSGELSPGQAIEVVYEFDDADASGKRHVARAESLPYRYTIQAAGRAWQDVRCRRLTTRVVSADGRGNRVVSDTPAAKVRPAGPIPSLDPRMLNGIVPNNYVLQPKEQLHLYKLTTVDQAWRISRSSFVPRLDRSTAELLADLAGDDDATRRLAAAGLIMRRDPAAWDALERIALQDTSRLKYYAIQALFWTDARRAWPVMEKLLRRDPAARFAPDVDGRTEDATHLNVSSMIAALCGKGRIEQATPLICDVLNNQSRAWMEPRWAMLRALGRIGDSAAIPTLRRYSKGGGYDTNVVAIEALAALGDRESIPMMVKYLSTGGYGMRPEAGMRALAKVKAEGCTQQVAEHLASWRQARRPIAADTLAEIGDPAEALPALRAALAAEREPYSRRRMERAIRILEGKPLPGDTATPRPDN